MLAQTVQATQPAAIATMPALRTLPRFVTLAFAWGFEDGAQGNRSQPWAYWTPTDARYAEYSDGYADGQAAAQTRRQ